MKKLFTLLFCFISACSFAYDKTIFTIDSDVKLESINSNAVVRSTDGSIVANIHGISIKDQVVFYKVIWFDENNMPINTILSSCVREQLLKDAPFNWSIVAPSKKAKSFKVTVFDRCVKDITIY